MGTGSVANSGNAITVGNQSVVNGAGSTAVGFNNSVTGTSSGAFGTGNIVTGNSSYAFGDPNTINGSGTFVTGNNNTINGPAVPGNGDNVQVVGSNNMVASTASAAGSSVLGSNNTVNATNAVAIGNATTVTGSNAVAIGQGSAAGFANSAAFGPGATTGRVNQQVFGTATNTYTMPGVTSAASLAAQAGPLSVVTSDGAGNLATLSSASIASATSVAALDGRVSNLESNVKTLLASEASLIKARANARESQKDLLQHRISQLGEEITGLDAQISSKAKQLELINGELSGVQELYDKRLVPLTRLTTLQRETARIEGERGQLTSAIAETKSKIGEAQLQIVRLDQDFRTDVVKELGETQGKEAELVERGVAARDLLDRIEIRAPTSGVIHQLSAHTVGGVIRAGDAIMEVVPDSDDLQIEARLQPNDIDQVRTGQKAFVRFSAFNQRVTPQLTGMVSYVSADTSHDQQTNSPYFTVRVALSEDERRRLAGLQLVPGMPAEVFMQTGSRTMMSYLLKPITDQMQRAFVEK